MATKVTYNGITIYNANTKLWELTVVRDPSNTDAIFHKFRMRFEGHIHVQPDKDLVSDAAPTWTGQSSGHFTTNDAVEHYDIISRSLITQRRPFLVEFGSGVEAFRCNPPVASQEADRFDVDLDVDNGPKPNLISLTQIVSNKVFRVEFEIECAKVHCEDETLINDILSNRWSISEEMDENFFTTRMIRGQLRMAFSDNKNGVTEMVGHIHRSVIIPPLEDGFKRTRLHMDVTPDGLTANYMIEDKQIDTAAPWPATRIEGSMTYAAEIGGKEACAPILNGKVRLFGSPGCKVQLLIARALQVLDARMQCLTGSGLDNWFANRCRITEVFGPVPIVDAEISAMSTRDLPKSMPEMAMLIPPQQLGERLILLKTVAGHGYDYTKSTVPYVFGTGPGGGERRPTVLMLLHCYLQNPCSEDHAMPTVDAGSTRYGEQARKPTDVTIAESEYTIPFEEPSISTQHKTAIYTMGLMQSHYLLDNVRVQLPIAATVGGEDGEDDDTSAVITLSKGQARREIVYDAERMGVWPEMPTPANTYTDGTLKATLLKHSQKLHPPILGTDGKKRVFRIRAHYLYALNRPPREDERLRVGVLPFTNLARADTEFQPSLSYAPRLDPP